MDPDTDELNTTGTIVPGAGQAPSASPCPECASRAPLAPQQEQFAYVIGRIDVRFPSLGIEREYQQRERALSDLPKQPRNARVRAVLEQNPHLATRVGWILSIGGNPAFALNPATPGLKESFFNALSSTHEIDHFCVVIGRVGPFVNPANFGGLLLPVLLVDQMYVSTQGEWAVSLGKSAQAVLKTHKIGDELFQTVSRDIFRDVTGMPDNMGISDGHRALNYLLVQHPGMFLAAAQRENHLLDRIETRVQQTAGGRQHVAVIMTFVDRACGIAERVFCSVDITEEWPFVVGGDGSTFPLGFAPFLENGFYAAA
jgi:hypothetical protein